MSETLEIVRLGHAGHGVTADGLFVPLTIPGDVVQVVRHAGRVELEQVVAPGPWRIAPVCRHFGRCGGCALQMVEKAAYLAWKRELVVAALRQRGFADPFVEAIHSVPAGTRRRAVLKCRKLASGVAAGFYEAESHRLVDIEECPVLVAELAAMLAPVKQGLASVLKPGEQAELRFTATDSGIDLLLKFDRGRSPDLLMELSRLAAGLKVARLCWNGEPVVLDRTPVLQFGSVTVSLPPGSFLQPSKAGENLLQQLVLAAAEGARRVADLFCGCGTFAFVLAGISRVQAVDNSEAQIDAVNDAARRSAATVTGEVRDLFRRPLTSVELQPFDLVVLDPPRAGAPAQARNLAQSAVHSILYISCNAATFARDARTLCDGGYRLVQVVPVDQFLWSPHVELFAQFSR